LDTKPEINKILFLKQLQKVFTVKRAAVFLCVVAAAVISVLLVYSTEAYKVSIDGEPVGIVKKEADAQAIVEEIVKKAELEYGTQIVTPSRLTFEKVLLAGKNTEEDELRKRMEDRIDLRMKAFVLNVDGKDIACFKDQASAREVLDRIKEPYKAEEEKGAVLGFLENVSIIERGVPLQQTDTVDEVFNNIFLKSEQTKKYIVKEGDTVSEIAEEYGLKLADIQKANPDLDIDRISIGQELNLMVPRYIINVTSTVYETYEEPVPYEVEYEETADLYKGETKVKVPGTEGRKLVKAEIVSVNGIKDEVNIIEETVLEEPKKAVVLKGTKARPRTMATGTFANPTRGSLTSRFGQRWSRQHEGIDIGAPSGSPIKAADGGKVIFAGWKGNYGRLVIIDHENGYTTYYGHCSTIKVKVGQRVAKGDVIALVGSTGRSTGPHLHFEVRKNGVAVNPLKFVKY